MLMTMSINAFANNANENEKNATKVVVEKSVSRSILDPNVPIELNVGQETDWFAVPEQIGYECTGYAFTPLSGRNCVTVVTDPTRNIYTGLIRLLKLMAQAEGRVYLRLIYTPINGGPTIEIVIEIIVNR